MRGATIKIKQIKNRKKKGKFIPLHSVKAHKGSRGITPLILSLGTR